MTIDERPHGELLRQVAKRTPNAMAIVDQDGGLLFDNFAMAGSEFSELCAGARLAPDFEAFVKRLIRDGQLDCEPGSSAIALYGANSYVRVHPVRDARAPYSLVADTFLVSIETLRNRDELADATRRFRLTLREAEILSYLMHGRKASEIALALNLAEGTVQNYYKRLLTKTRSRNRAAMVAAVLGWARPDERPRAVS